MILLDLPTTIMTSFGRTLSWPLGIKKDLLRITPTILTSNLLRTSNSINDCSLKLLGIEICTTPYSLSTW